MSWVARRNTTRVEDIAYCLLGIFEIHMPLLYGEGNRAFIRLQEEILKTIEDYTVLARDFYFSLFTHPSYDPWPHGFQPCALAYEIEEFDISDGGVPTTLRYSNLQVDNDTPGSDKFNSGVGGGSTYNALAMTSKGLYISLPLRKMSNSFYMAYLHCKHRSKQEAQPKLVCMALELVTPGRYRRTRNPYYAYLFLPTEALKSFKVVPFYIEQNGQSLEYMSRHVVPLSASNITVQIDPTVFSDGFMTIPNGHRDPTSGFSPCDHNFFLSGGAAPEILCFLGERDSFLVKFGSVGTKRWCHCFLDPEAQTEMTYIYDNGLDWRMPQWLGWECLPGFWPEYPKDRFRAVLRSNTGIVSVSIREAPSTPPATNMGIVARIKIEQSTAPEGRLNDARSSSRSRKRVSCKLRS